MNFAETGDFLQLAWAAGKSVLLSGNHGIGKSSVVQDFHARMQARSGEAWGWVDLRLSQQDVGDLRGIPFRVNGATFFAPPLWLPIDAGYQEQLGGWLAGAGEAYRPFQNQARGVLFLDEFNRASREVLQCAFELVLDRRLGGVPIPAGWLVVAAVNGDSDLYEVARLDAALRNRFACADFSPSVEDWFAWARPRVEAGKMHSAVFQYLLRMPHKLDPGRADLEKALDAGHNLYTRRSWSALGEMMAQGLVQGMDLTDFSTPARERWATEVYSGFLGATQAVAFAHFVKTDFEVLQPREILEGWNEEVAKRLRALCASQRPMELLGLNQSLVEELGQRPPCLSRAQQERLLAYVNLVPNEVAMDFFTQWTRKHKAQVEKIYEMPALDAEGQPLRDPRNGKVVQPFKQRICEIAYRKKEGA